MSWQTILDQLLKMVGVPTQWTGVIQVGVLSITVLGIIAQSINWALRANADTGLFKTRPTKIKERWARIDEQLETVTEQNSGMVPLLKSEQDLLLFEEMSGIQAKPALRKKLVYLHEISPSTFTWKTLKHTAQYISEETPDVQIKMILLDSALY